MVYYKSGIGECPGHPGVEGFSSRTLYEAAVLTVENKTNLVAEGPGFTTKPEVIKTLARLMKNAGKDVSIGEGSASAGGFNWVTPNLLSRCEFPSSISIQARWWMCRSPAATHTTRYRFTTR